MTKSKNTENSTTPKSYASRGANVAKGGVLSKYPTCTACIEKMVGKETKRKKKKEQKKTENDTVKQLAPAKNGLLDKDKASGIIKKKSSKKEKKKNKNGSSSSSSYSSSDSKERNCYIVHPV